MLTVPPIPSLYFRVSLYGQEEANAITTASAYFQSEIICKVAIYFPWSTIGEILMVLTAVQYMYKVKQARSLNYASSIILATSSAAHIVDASESGPTPSLLRGALDSLRNQADTVCTNRALNALTERYWVRPAKL